MQKIISFFLASSITDIELDRLSIGDFINQLNNIYHKKNIFIKLYKCENSDMDHSVKTGGSQKFLDEIIKTSDLCFVIFWKKVGDLTKHELEIALQSYTQNQQPKVIVYFKKIPESETIPEDIINIMNIIDNELMHYHREYDHIDSLKLGIITQLQVHGFVDADLHIENDKVCSDNEPLLSVNKIPLFSDNTEYSSLLLKLQDLQEKIDRLKENYQSEPNLNTYRELAICSKEYKRSKEDLNDLTKNILDIGVKLAKITTDGLTVNNKIREAIKLFDKGDYDGVLNILSPEDIDDGLEKLNAIENNLRDQRIVFIEEYRLRILALKAKMNWKEVYSTYKSVIEQVILRPDMPQIIVYEFALYLFEQKNYNECCEICNRLIDIFNFAKNTDIQTLASLYSLLGKAYYYNKTFNKSIDSITKSLTLGKSLSDTLQEKNFLLAESSYYLANIYYVLNRHKDAEVLYQDAISFFKNCEYTDNIKFKLAITNKELAQLYYQTNRHEKAANLYEEALKSLKLTGNLNSLSTKEAIAELCNRLSGLYCAIIRHKFTDRYFVPALQTKNTIIQQGDRIFYEYIVSACNKLAEIYTENNYADIVKKLSNLKNKLFKKPFYNDNNSEDFLTENYSFYNNSVNISIILSLNKEAVNIAEELAQYNPQAYESTLADVYILSGETLVLNKNFKEAELYFNKALDIQQKLLSLSQSTEIATATIFCNYGFLYFMEKNYALSIKYYKKALSIYKKYAVLNPGAFDNELARTYCYIGNIYVLLNKKENANKFYYCSLSLYLALYKKSPKAYIDRVINVISNVIHLLYPDYPEQKMRFFLY